jgi:hypothetical protein
VTAPEPTYELAVDDQGDPLSLSPTGEVWWRTGEYDPADWPGWRRLYVQREPDGGEPA